MKIVFSTKNVNRASFLDVCRYAYDYGFSGFEIYDALKERSFHHDSILRRERTPDARRKLINRNLSVSALRMPYPCESEETTSEIVIKYIDMAANAGISNVIIRVEEETSFELLKEKLGEGIKRAEKSDVGILFETVGFLSDTEKVIEYAETKLGMVKAESYQITYINLSQGDEFVVAGDKEVSQNSGLKTEIKELFAYIF